jgi:hypothetical protein
LHTAKIYRQAKGKEKIKNFISAILIFVKILVFEVFKCFLIYLALTRNGKLAGLIGTGLGLTLQSAKNRFNGVSSEPHRVANGFRFGGPTQQFSLQEKFYIFLHGEASRCKENRDFTKQIYISALYVNMKG